MKSAVLILIICCWSATAFIYRIIVRRNLPHIWVGFGVACTWFALNVLLTLLLHARPLSAPGVLFAAGAIGGLATAAAVPLFISAVARGNLAVSWTILTLSFAAAAVLSLLYPGGGASAAGIVGLLVAGLAIVALGLDGGQSGVKSGFKRGWGVFMALAFTANTFFMYSYPLAEKWAGLAPLDNKMAMLLSVTATFVVTAGLISLFSPSARGRGLAMVFGAGVGICLFVGNYASTVALGDLAVAPYVFFPATTGGSTIAVALASATLLREHPSRLGWVGLTLGLAAIVLLGAVA
ncbi:MAG: hypothetical protein J7M19_07500 [Planctomycetes bacterium]|nr:hypothetical protein [Planctomycetota bacterium]